MHGNGLHTCGDAKERARGGPALLMITGESKLSRGASSQECRPWEWDKYVRGFDFASTQGRIILFKGLLSSRVQLKNFHLGFVVFHEPLLLCLGTYSNIIFYSCRYKSRVYLNILLYGHSTTQLCRALGYRLSMVENIKSIPYILYIYVYTLYTYLRMQLTEHA